MLAKAYQKHELMIRKYENWLRESMLVANIGRLQIKDQLLLEKA